MTVPATPARSKHHRFPAESISHGVWRYYRVCLSYRDVEERLFARGVIVTYEAIRQWCRKCGQAYANQRRRRHPRPGDKWPLDEVGLTIHGARHDLGRAVDQDGHGLDMLVPSRRHTTAAQTCCRPWLHGLTDVPGVLSTAQGPRSGAAKRESLPGGEPRPPRALHHRAAHAPQPTRPRARRRPRVKSPGHAPRCLAASGPSAHPCRPRRHRLAAPEYRHAIAPRCQIGRAITGAAVAASGPRAVQPSSLASSSWPQRQ
jgi:putative transposase